MFERSRHYEPEGAETLPQMDVAWEHPIRTSHAMRTDEQHNLLANALPEQAPRSTLSLMLEVSTESVEGLLSRFLEVHQTRFEMLDFWSFARGIDGEPFLA